MEARGGLYRYPISQQVQGRADNLLFECHKQASPFWVWKYFQNNTFKFFLLTNIYRQTFAANFGYGKHQA